jgi:hypothetical protein
MMTSYHTRNYTPQHELLTGEAMAEKQEAAILDFFMANQGVRFTPFEVKEAVNGMWEITSVRRAITNLTTGKKLIKDEFNRKPGAKGKSNCTWYYPCEGQTNLF